MLSFPENKRIICISDIHGELDLFKKLLAKVNFDDNDILILLGDLYLKGSREHECLKYIIEMSKQPNIYILKGNCDRGLDDYLLPGEQEWLDGLPYTIESDNYVFVHGGTNSDNYNNFMEVAEAQEKWTIAGHWPAGNYCYEIDCCNPIINNEKRIISIDGGNVLRRNGQLNAFIIDNGQFSFKYIDNLPKAVVTHKQKEAKGSLNITWLDRFVTKINSGKEFSLVKHNKTGIELEIPTESLWIDDNGNLCCLFAATNHWLAACVGDEVSVISSFSDKHLAKKDGITGWIKLETIE